MESKIETKELFAEVDFEWKAKTELYIYRQVSSLESYMSRVLNTVVEPIRLEDKLELLHMNFIYIYIYIYIYI
jgi:hypothetical protein